MPIQFGGNQLTGVTGGGKKRDHLYLRIVANLEVRHSNTVGTDRRRVFSLDKGCEVGDKRMA